VKECRHMGVVPHVVQNLARRGGSAIDGRTTRHAGYCAPEQGTVSRSVQSPPDFYACLRSLQSGANAKSGRPSCGGVTSGLSCVLRSTRLDAETAKPLKNMFLPASSMRNKKKYSAQVTFSAAC